MNGREGRKRISRAMGEAKNFFFPLKAMGVTEGFISREVMCVDLKFTKICWAEVGKQQKGESLGRRHVGGLGGCGGIRGEVQGCGERLN